MDAKIGIEHENGSILIKIDKNRTLSEIIEVICKKIKLINRSYDLKFTHTSDLSHLNTYVTEENKIHIKDGCKFTLVESLESIINQLFKSNRDDLSKLYELSFDPGFINALVKHNCQEIILEWIERGDLHGEELCGCLIVLLNLIKRHYIEKVRENVLISIISCVQNTFPAMETQFAIALLCQILYLKDPDANETIHAAISINDLIPFIWSAEHPTLQLNTLMLINALVKSAAREKKRELILKMSKQQTKAYIFKHIISTNVNDEIAHELYVYQTYILSLYNNSLNENIKLDSDFTVNYQLLEGAERINPFTFDESNKKQPISRSNSTISTDSAVFNSPLPNYESTHNMISSLSLRCIDYCKHFHEKSFYQIKEEVGLFEADLFVICERITRLLAKILHINKSPKRNCSLFHPVIFNGALKEDFFCELFYCSIVLFVKAKHDMKLHTVNDIDKLFLVLDKQIQMVLAEKPTNYTILMDKILKISYKTVLSQWQVEDQNEWKNIYNHNPSVQELKNRLRFANQTLVDKKYMKTLQFGEYFPTFKKKAKYRQFFIKLSENHKTFHYGDYNESFKSLALPNSFSVSDIVHFLTGQSSPYLKDHVVKNSKLVFSLILISGEVFNFVAKNENMANVWCDSLNILLGKKERSNNYYNELETLIEMDCAIHLVELQNVPLPKQPPVIPELPAFLEESNM